MPAWASIYILLYFLTVVGSVWYVSRMKFATSLLILDSLSSVILAYLFCGYWIPEIIDTIGWLAPTGLCLAFVWSVYSWKRVYSDQDFLKEMLENESQNPKEQSSDRATEEEKKEISESEMQAATNASMWISILCNMPAYIFGILAVARWINSQL